MPDHPARQRRGEGEGVERHAVELAATVGITVVTAVASNATKAISANMPIVVAAYAGREQPLARRAVASSRWRSPRPRAAVSLVIVATIADAGPHVHSRSSRREQAHVTGDG